MWWEKKSQPVVPTHSPQTPAPEGTAKVENTMTDKTSRVLGSTGLAQNQTLLGQSVVLRGDLSGKEDLVIEGQFEGTINLQENCLTVGPHGQVKAEIHARQVIIQGSVSGNISTREKVEIRRSGNVVGDLVAAAIAIEDGAYFKGSIDIVREQAEATARPISASRAVEADT